MTLRETLRLIRVFPSVFKYDFFWTKFQLRRSRLIKTRGSAGQTHQNYSDKNCNISNCKALIINALDLLMLDKFRIFIV